ncbi:MAG: saccharopine dehydrogenase C-terminal domain-containing protein [Pseudomonadota bacterium]
MSVLVVGVGMQGRAVVHELCRGPSVGPVVAADLDAGALARALGRSEAIPEPLDASDEAATRGLIRRHGAGLVVSVVPPALQAVTARAAVAEGAHFVNTCYADRLGELDASARARGVILLPEMGLDPGIDLLLCRLACDELDEVEGLLSYGAGLPLAENAAPPFRYKVSWSFEGVLSAYRRPARYRAAGEDRDVPALGAFDEGHVHIVDIAGPMEAYPNGDALAYARSFELGPGLTHMGRFTMRWPGHCALWRTLGAAGLLGEEPVDLGGVEVSPAQFLARWLGPRLQFGPDEPDLVLLRAHAWGRRGGEHHAVAWDLVDQRDPVSGLMAMNRTVGFTAAIAARMILDGEISGAGLLDPARDVPPEPVIAALRERGVEIVRREVAYGAPSGLR